MTPEQAAELRAALDEMSRESAGYDLDELRGAVGVLAETLRLVVASLPESD